MNQSTEQCHKCPYRLLALMYNQCPKLILTGQHESVHGPGIYTERFFLECPGIDGTAGALEIHFRDQGVK